jgi:hypothetical protein
MHMHASMHAYLDVSTIVFDELVRPRHRTRVWPRRISTDELESAL